MATDDLLDDKDTPPAKDATKDGLSKADLTAAVKESLTAFEKQQDEKLGQFAKDVGVHVNATLQGYMQKVNEGTATKQESDIVQRLLTNPEVVIEELLQKNLAKSLGPYLHTQVNDSYDELVEKHRTQIDARWGDGAFDELIMPDLEATVKATRDPAAKASKEYIATVVRGIVGHEKILPKLEEKRDAMKAKNAERERDEGPTGILDGGRPKPRKPTLSDTDRAFLSDYEKVIGTKVDTKRLEAIRTARLRDGGLDIDNFPQFKS